MDAWYSSKWHETWVDILSLFKCTLHAEMLSLNHYTVSLGFLGLYDRKNSYLRIYIYSHSLSDILSLFSQCDSMTVSQKKAFITLSLTCEYLSWFFFFFAFYIGWYIDAVVPFCILSGFICVPWPFSALFFQISVTGNFFFSWWSSAVHHHYGTRTLIACILMGFFITKC